MTIDPSVWIRTVCKKNGRELTDDQIPLLEKYVSLLLEWNSKINLISRRDVENIWESHIAHSISPLFRIDIPDDAAVLDLGTGGGLPGIPWRILLPSISITMIDATQKKVNAVQSMIGELGLSHADAVWGRAEELGRSERFRGKYDYVVARAVGPLYELARIAEPFLANRKMGTTSGKRPAPETRSLLVFKGGEIEEELNRTRRSKGVESVEVLSLAFDGSSEIGLIDKKLAIVKFTKDPM